MSDERRLAIVLGLGEVGHHVWVMLAKAYGVSSPPSETDPVQCYDPYKIPEQLRYPPIGEFEFMHVCYPQGPGFVQSIQEYAEKYEPSHIIIHSTISPGILENLQPNVHAMLHYSPVRGNMRDGMMEGLKGYTKYIASFMQHLPGEEDAQVHLIGAGFKIKPVSQINALIWAKLLDLAWYGLNIAFYQEVERIVPELWDYNVVKDFIESTPVESEGKARRELFYGGYIGGHCVIQGIEKILAEKDIPMLRAVIDSNIKREVELASEKPLHHP
jgi:hypothetical protein